MSIGYKQFYLFFIYTYKHTHTHILPWRAWLLTNLISSSLPFYFSYRPLDEITLASLSVLYSLKCVGTTNAIAGGNLVQI
ncbi:hypothetical protein CLU79DRAFT_755978 [Phycomyces nitens]|nr:hypothetical protein CLU79DRAFT_755978 [Phycomyces nitens]